MLNDFSKSADYYRTRVDLTEQECASLNRLGKELPALLPSDETTLSDFFTEICGKSFGSLDPMCGFVTMQASLYTSIEDEGHERIPRLTYIYANGNYAGPQDADLHIVFIPAHLANLHYQGRSDTFLPQIIKSPENPDSIHRSDARSVLDFALNVQRQDRMPAPEMK